MEIHHCVQAEMTISDNVQVVYPPFPTTITKKNAVCTSIPSHSILFLSHPFVRPHSHQSPTECKTTEENQQKKKVERKRVANCSKLGRPHNISQKPGVPKIRSMLPLLGILPRSRGLPQIRHHIPCLLAQPTTRLTAIIQKRLLGVGCSR